MKTKLGTARMRRWRTRNKEKDRINQKNWRANNPDKNKAKYKRWYKKNRSRLLKKYKKYLENNRDKINARVRLFRHGVTKEWHAEQMKAQDGKCAICLNEFIKTPHIDHNHDCCKTLTSCDRCRRELLCTDCNLGLGRFKDSVFALQQAIQYLKKHESAFKEQRTEHG